MFVVIGVYWKLLLISIVVIVGLTIAACAMGMSPRRKRRLLRDWLGRMRRSETPEYGAFKQAEK